MTSLSAALSNLIKVPNENAPKKRRLEMLAEKMVNGNNPKKPFLSEYDIHRFRLDQLMHEKEKFILKQRQSTLVIDPRRIDDDGIMSNFSSLYQDVSRLAAQDRSEQLVKLLGDIVKGSVIVEWPRAVYGVHKCGHDEPTEVDQAPLIHRARNVVKCRTSHPTMRIKVYAITSATEQARSTKLDSGPSLNEAFFRCSLTKAQSGLIGEVGDTRNLTIAGKMILTQREGSTAPKTVADRLGAVVSPEGKLVSSMAGADTHEFRLLDEYKESMRSTTLKFENGVLCATFPEMGVTLNSMIDRRQLATRYAILVETGVNIDGIVVKHAFQSLPFLIAITNDQTEPLLNSMIWSRMLERENYDGSEVQGPISYGTLREGAKMFVKSQISQARALTDRELLHFQAMVFYPKVNKCRNEDEVDKLENLLYLDQNEVPETIEQQSGDGMVLDIDKTKLKKELLRKRLLEEFVMDHVTIEKHDFMVETCVSILDGRSELRHTPWQWLFKATELILDVGHKLCPSPAIAEKKSTKTKKQLAAAEEYHTMMSLFNKGVISFFSVFDTHKAFLQLKENHEDNSVLMLRFCDENAGHVAFVFGLKTINGEEKLEMGSIAGDTLKDFKQGLSEALLDEEYPASHEKLVRMGVHGGGFERLCSTIRKRSLFNTYQSLRQVETKTPFPEEQITYRVNPFSGVEINREKLKLQSSFVISPPDESFPPLSLPFPSEMPSFALSEPPTITKSGKKRRGKEKNTSPPTSSTAESELMKTLMMMNENKGNPEIDLSVWMNLEDSASLSRTESPSVSSPWPLSTTPAAAAAAAVATPPTSASPSAKQPAVGMENGEAVAAILEQPMFQSMLSQLMSQTLTQMLSSGADDAMDGEASESTSEVKNNGVPSALLRTLQQTFKEETDS